MRGERKVRQRRRSKIKGVGGREVQETTQKTEWNIVRNRKASGRSIRRGRTDTL
jgi:hypothetical protein